MMTSRTTTALASKAPSGSKGARLTRIALALTTALTPVCSFAQTLPTGGTVAHGDVAIGAPSAGTLTIDQSSDRAVVNWDGFSIGAGNRVTINQPSADAAILNRVTGDTTSQIHGQLNANGRVFVVNPNGIFIGATGSVNAGGFVASTLGIRNDDFVLGNTVFEGDGSSATVSNAGNIEVVTGGYAALIGGQVSNSGTIQAPMGFVGLGSGERITLDLGGDGFMQVAVPTDSDDPALQALIENSGTIQANGGTVQMSAATARTAARHAINMSGVVEARTVSGRNGRITLGGGAGGTVSVTGTVRATARRPAIQVTQSARPTLRPARGGDITITGQNITLAGADIDASGTDVGGDIRIGGNLQGAVGLPTAETLSADADTTINANAILTGDGGRVILWSDLHTEFYGDIAVRGGDESGNGGFAEVSGKQNLTYRGFVDALAPNGETGELLLDPNDIQIVAAAPGTNELLATDVETILAGADLTISTTPGATFPGDASEPGTITVEAPITWSTTNTLTLEADASIIIDAAITATTGGLTLDAGVSTNPITTGAAGSIDVGTFVLETGAWQQNDATLPAFNATNFVIETGSFLRVLGGDGLTVPYQLTDIYGLQGVGTVDGGTANFELVNDIDATPVFTWESLAQDGNGNRNEGFDPLDYSGTLDGNRFTISNLYVARVASLSVGTDAGLFSSLTSTAAVNELNFTDPFLTGSTTGTVAAFNNGFITGVSVEGGNVASFGQYAGGIAGVNEEFGDIEGARVNSIIGIGSDPSDGVGATLALKEYGGIAGSNAGVIESSKSDGSINMRFVTEGFVGGIAGTNTFSGSNPGLIANSYSDLDVEANVSDAVTTSIAIGGITGENLGIIENVIATGSVNLIGTNGGTRGGVGGLTGTDVTGSGTVVGSYFDTGTTGQTVSGAAGEAAIDAQGVTTAFLNDAAAFSTDAENNGWDFEDDWAIPQDGVDQARLYLVDPVVTATDNSAATPTFVYTSNTDDFTAPSSAYFGGPSEYFFGPLGDSGILADMDDDIELSDSNVGSVTFTFPTEFTSVLGQDFDVRSLPVSATVTPATLIVAIDDTTKAFGDTLTFADLSLITDVLLGSDTLTSATVVSAGAPANASIGGSPYIIDLTGFVGTGLTNYNISTVTGSLTITQGALTISVNSATKTYGDLLVFNGTEFTTSGLATGDTVTSLGISSSGAVETATVAGGPYTIDGTNPTGTGLANYVITIVPGSLTVAQRPALINVPSVSKVYGETIGLDNSNFTVSGLVNGDTISSLTLSSAGTPATAIVGDSPYAISASNPGGSGADNYALNVTSGTITVTPASLTITADDQDKRAGTEFTFTGTEFTVSGLLNTDEVTSATLTSAATAASAGLTGEAGTAILITDPQGDGLDNYNITLVNGIFVVAPGDLVITANDLTKVYGSELVFDGDEFTVTGLADGDSVDSITLVSAGAADTTAPAGALFSILGSAAVGSGLDKYELVFADGTLTVVPAPLTVTVLDQTKQQGQTLTFNGSEFATSGLLNSDSVDSVVLSSLGAAPDALADDSPFVITLDNVNGSGLDNYDITSVNGELTVLNLVTPPITNPVTPGNTSLPNPPDTISIGFTSTSNPFTPSGDPAAVTDAASGPQSATGTGSGPQQTLGGAEAALAVVDDVSGDLEIAIQSCGNADQDFTNYMACLSESLDTYANALDQIANDLPAGLENVSAVIQQARVGVDAAAARAQRRLAGATSNAERRAIRVDALNEARGAINEAQAEIRKAIGLIRADDPEIAAVQRQTGARIIQAFDTVDSQLVRAVEL